MGDSKTSGKISIEKWQPENSQNKMATISIHSGKTCPRCGLTEEELSKAVSALRQSLATLGIKVILEKEELSVSEFEKDPLQSNRIWMNDRPLEDYIKGNVGQSPCCEVRRF